MGLILLEALLALVLLVGIVWWTMFSGRKKGELPDAARKPPPDEDQR
jgi:cbb3-type cytochrome oxidase subunit 3